MNPSLAGPLAHAATATLLPMQWPFFNGVDGVELHARYHAECRGGDFFDAVAVGHRLLFLLTDIAGPRQEAYSVAVTLQAVFREKAAEIFAAETVNESDALAALAHVVNVSLVEAADGVRLAPTFLGCFNKPLGILSYCNAGNLLAMVREGSGVVVLQSGGMPLGLFTHTTFEAVVLAFEPGDTLLVVTKGVIESRRGSTEFGTKRVEALLKASTARSAAELCEAVLQQAYNHANDPWSRVLRFFHPGDPRREDDLTALALIRRAPCAAPTFVRDYAARGKGLAQCFPPGVH